MGKQREGARSARLSKDGVYIFAKYHPNGNETNKEEFPYSTDTKTNAIIFSDPLPNTANTEELDTQLSKY